MYGLTGIDLIKLNKEKLAEIYNCSDIDALEYMSRFCDGEWKVLCDRMIFLNQNTTLGDGDRTPTGKESNEYTIGKWKLLNHFEVYSCNGDAYIKEKFEELEKRKEN